MALGFKPRLPSCSETAFITPSASNEESGSDGCWEEKWGHRGHPALQLHRRSLKSIADCQGPVPPWLWEAEGGPEGRACCARVFEVVPGSDLLGP